MMFLLTNGIEVYKPLVNMNFEFVWKFFSKNPVPHNLRKGYLVYLPPDRSSSRGTNFLAFRGSLIWNSLPSNRKRSYNLE